MKVRIGTMAKYFQTKNCCYVSYTYFAAINNEWTFEIKSQFSYEVVKLHV